MKRFALTIAVVLTVTSVNAYALVGDAVGKIERLEKKSQKAIKLPKIKKGRIKDSFKYYILPDRELPLVKAVIMIKGGSVFEPIERAGLSSITTSLMRLGGAGGLSPDEVNEKLDFMASSININADSEYISATMVSRTENFEATFKLLLDILFRPGFDPDRFELLKRQAKDSIKRREDSPKTLASIGFNGLIYGEETHWGSYVTQETIDNITLKDVKEYHRRFFHPENMIIGVSGDAAPRKILYLLKSYAGYPEERAKEITIPGGQPIPKTGIHLIDKETAQVIFNIGQEGTNRFNPDKYSLIIMNDILGAPGSFKKRLPALIRVEMGLAYTVWSRYGFGPKEAPGVFKIFLATKTRTALKALEAVLRLVEDFAKGDNITEAELDLSKRSTLERLVFEYSSAFNIISSMVHFNYYGYPDNYIEEYGEKIDKVTLSDVRSAARNYLHPDNFQIVVVGSKKRLEGQFKKHFKVEELTINN